MKVLIGIQARSTSSRLPNKALEVICGITVLGRVIDACTAAATQINKRSKGVEAGVVVLTPTGDAIVESFRDRCPIFEGPEHDVLARYAMALDEYEPDYMVRITGDCPLLPSSVVSGLTSMAIHHRYDYFSNVDERFRTAMDGVDCEVISARLLRHTDAVAKDRADREHVTTFIRKAPQPEWAKLGLAVNHFDHSHIKCSVDTPEDLDAARRIFDSAFSKYQAATRVYGKGRVHRQ